MPRIALFALALLVVALPARPAVPEKPKNRVDIAIRDRQYAPVTVTIKKGQTVVWTNYDDIDHTVDAADGSFSSGTIKKNGTWQQMFILPGKYAYLCKLHPRMKGQVIVE